MGDSKIIRTSTEHVKLLRDFANKMSAEKGIKIGMSDASRLLVDIVRRENLLNRVKLEGIKKRKVRTKLDYEFRLF